jgi:hypothetical protein
MLFEIIDLQTYVFHWITFRLAVSRKNRGRVHGSLPLGLLSRYVKGPEICRTMVEVKRSRWVDQGFLLTVQLCHVFNINLVAFHALEGNPGLASA